MDHDAFVGNLERGAHTWAEEWLPVTQLIGIEDPGIVVAIGSGLLEQLGEGSTLIGVPGDHRRARPLERDPGPLCVLGKEVESPRHQLGLLRPGHAVESCVKNGGVGLGGSLAEVVGLIDQQHVERAAS